MDIIQRQPLNNSTADARTSLCGRASGVATGSIAELTAYNDASYKRRTAVIIPAFNEAVTIGRVIEAFREALPDATIYVYDNNSTDGTAEIAQTAGANVRSESRQGKGNVVRRMFADIDADIYVMVDGDDTYHTGSASRLIEELRKGPFDMVNGARVAQSTGAYRLGHEFGNRLLTALVRQIFGGSIDDMLSGYKVFSRRYVKSFPARSYGFEVETELLVHALELRMPVSEIRTSYRERPDGSHSKLRSLRDGVRILQLISFLVKQERPILFFGLAALALALLSILAGTPVVVEFLQTGLVPRLPTAVLALGLMLAAMLALMTGMILDGITQARREVKRQYYLSVPPLH